jgi:hypothetical protein
MVGQMVQRATKIVKRVSDGQSDNGRNVFSYGEIIAALSFVRIILWKNHVTAALEKGCPLGLQITDVFLGPF